MSERTSPRKEVAKRHGVSSRTIKRWIQQAGYGIPAYQRQIPQWLEDLIVQKRSPRIARIRA